MGMLDLLQFQNFLNIHGIMISFSGQFSQGIIEEISEAIEKHLQKDEISKSNIFNVISIFVEQSQNIRNYIFSKEDQDTYERISASGIIAIGKTGDGYFVHSGNLIAKDDIPPISDKLNKIKMADKNELKKMYKEQMKKVIPPGALGAGLGLIDIARKASYPIEYSFVKCDDKFSFYHLHVII